MSDKSILFKDECYAINGAVFEVYREMGYGFLESVYQESLAKEFTLRGIPFATQPELKLSYKQQSLLQICKPDFICFEKIIAELKAVKAVAPKHIDAGVKVGLPYSW